MRMKLATTLAALALVPGGLAFTSPASADTSLLSCPLGTQNTHYTPGLTQATRSTSFKSDGVVGACVDLSGHGIAGAAYTITGQGTAACSSRTWSSPVRSSPRRSPGISSAASRCP